MSDRDPLAAFPVFVAAVAARLEAGRMAYGDRSFSRPPAELVAELEQEALDLAGWGFVLWTRLRAMRTALGSPACGRPPAAQARASQQPATTRAGRVLCMPLLRQPDHSFAAGQALELSRVPCVGEWIDLPEGSVRVMAVRHTPAGAADAELYVDTVVVATQAEDERAAEGDHATSRKCAESLRE